MEPIESLPAAEPLPDAPSPPRRSRYLVRRRAETPTTTMLVSVTVLAMVASAIAATVFAGLVSVVVDGVSGKSVSSASPLMAILLALVGEGTFAAVGYLGARSETPEFWNRLGFRRPRVSNATLALAAVGTILFPALGLVLYQALGASAWFGDQHDEFTKLAATIAAMPIVWKILMVVVVGVAPGVCEETLFRGFLLRGLAKRWPAWGAILISGIVFEASHFNARHAIIHVLTGFWFGYLAVRCDSIVPAIFAHAFNNVFWGALMAVSISATGGGVHEPPNWGITGIMLAIGAVPALAAIWRIEKSARTLVASPEIAPADAAPIR
jgi:membrane protease YdiL (CAAX protease family)